MITFSDVQAQLRNQYRSWGTKCQPYLWLDWRMMLSSQVWATVLEVHPPAQGDRVSGKRSALVTGTGWREQDLQRAGGLPGENNREPSEAIKSALVPGGKGREGMETSIEDSTPELPREAQKIPLHGPRQNSGERGGKNHTQYIIIISLANFPYTPISKESTQYRFCMSGLFFLE